MKAIAGIKAIIFFLSIARKMNKKDDICFVAEVEKIVIGAVWVRDMDDYGHVEEGILLLLFRYIKRIEAMEWEPNS